MDKVLAVLRLHGHFCDLCGPTMRLSTLGTDDDSSIDSNGDDIFVLQQSEDIVDSSRQSIVDIVACELTDEISEESSCSCEVLLQSSIVLHVAVVLNGQLHLLVKFGFRHVVEEALDDPFHFEVGDALLVAESFELAEELHQTSSVLQVVGLLLIHSRSAQTSQQRIWLYVETADLCHVGDVDSFEDELLAFSQSEPVHFDVTLEAVESVAIGCGNCDLSDC